MQYKYTLITGAGSGLGRELAIECARRKMNLLLVALPGSNLNIFSAQLMELYNVSIYNFEFDLTDDVSFFNRVESITNHYPINFLINNAGVGGTASILQCPVNKIDRIIKLNIRCTVLLTKIVLPSLLKNEKSYLLNISSMAAFSPIAYKTVYPASKAFISSFSLGLREELQCQGLSVSVGYPGPIMTNSNSSERILLQGYKARMGLLASGYLAKCLIEQTLNGKAIIIPGFWNRINRYILSVLPENMKTRIISANVKNELSVVPS